jgi:hypothetical protein
MAIQVLVVLTPKGENQGQIVSPGLPTILINKAGVTGDCGDW